ncbi:MAG: hypothetical protein GY817_03715 [bacterium]|nr:hypothetical protein [bacterium]
MFEVLEIIALIASIALPLWNIPLILRIIKRKSSKDISLSWAFGVWTCFILMFPVAMQSEELIWKTFSTINIICFTGVVLCVFLYRKK